MTDDIRAVLRENLEGMRKSLAWLKRSHEKCSRIGVKQRYLEDEFDDFENMSNRDARTLDVIVNKVFRSIDAVELEDGGTLLDVVNRNDIVNEYETDDLPALFLQTLEAIPELFAIAEGTEKYCQRFVEA